MKLRQRILTYERVATPTIVSVPDLEQLRTN